jgi:hypothetical protein
MNLAAAPDGESFKFVAGEERTGAVHALTIHVT